MASAPPSSISPAQLIEKVIQRNALHPRIKLDLLEVANRIRQWLETAQFGSVRECAIAINFAKRLRSAALVNRAASQLCRLAAPRTPIGMASCPVEWAVQAGLALGVRVFHGSWAKSITDCLPEPVVAHLEVVDWAPSIHFKLHTILWVDAVFGGPCHCVIAGAAGTIPRELWNYEPVNAHFLDVLPR